MIDPAAIAREIVSARANREPIAVLPSARGLDLPSAYAVEAELLRLRREDGRSPVGLKVGYANKAMWRVLKLDTLVWAHVYDDTVHYADGGRAALSGGAMIAPKIEPEIVFKLSAPIPAGTTDPAAVLAHVEWLALGFEIIDCVYPGWTFQPADFVAAFGLHAALVVGTPLGVTEAQIPGLVEALATFKVSLLKDGQAVAEGAGRNSLRSPALCLAELASARATHPDATPLAAGDFVSSGTLTESQLIHPGEQWTAEVAGLGVDRLTLDVTP